MTDNRFYEVQLTALGAFCLCGILLERYISTRVTHASKERREAGRSWREAAADSQSLARKYLLVYAVVMGADWLQGPYVYSLYKDEYAYPERIVALLFVTGFTSAGITAPVVGAWADLYGRKQMCLYFCLSYILACGCTLFNYLPILLTGRILAGFSTSILFSCFESWLISAAQTDGISQTDLSSIMGRASLINGFVASAAGVVSNEVVRWSNTFTSPFVTSACLLLLAYAMIQPMWKENYGAGKVEASTDLLQISRLKEAWHIVRNDTTLMVLCLTQTCFEGSMYLFVFLWVPFMQEASTSKTSLPLGFIFSAFMFSMMIGSLIYTSITTYTPPHTNDTPLVLHAKLSTLVCLVAGISLASSMTAATPEGRFWSFCAFEGCVGIYYPVQGTLRGSLISNDHRATLSSLFRLPLNVFVMVSLLSGVAAQRHLVFTGCTLVLIFSGVMTGLVIVKRATDIAGMERLSRPS